MLSEEANDRFKYMMKRVRAQIRKGNFDNVKTDDVQYLPTDLGMMLSHLFQMSLHQHLKTKLLQKMHQEKTQTISNILRDEAKTTAAA